MDAFRDTPQAPPFLIPLRERALLKLGGGATFDFLQRLVTCDVGQLSARRAMHGALLTPQGKLLHEFLLIRPDDRDFVLIEADVAGIDDLVRRLMLYRLRTPVEIARHEDFGVFACDPATAREMLADADDETPSRGEIRPLVRREAQDGFGFPDPRTTQIGARLYLPPDSQVEDRGEGSDHAQRRYAFGIAEGSGELPPERFFALEANLDLFGSVSFEKGCYVGQEVTTRTHRRGKVKKRLLAMTYEGLPPAAGTAIVGDAADGSRPMHIGEVTVPGENGIGLAFVRLAEAERARERSIRLADDGRPVRLFHPNPPKEDDRMLDE